MTVIRWAGFRGENRALHPKLLPEGACAKSANQKPGRGDLRPWRNPLTVANVPSGRNSIYRMGRDVASDADYWLSWTGTVHAVRGFETGDTTERTYYTGDGTPKVTDNVMGLAAAPYPTADRPLGIPAPATGPIVTVTDPELAVIQAGQPARTEVVVAPRVITHVAVVSVSMLFATRKYVKVWLEAGHGIVTGDKVNVVIDGYPGLSKQDATAALQSDGLSITYSIDQSVAAFAQTVATGSVTKSSDTVFYPEVPQITADPESLGARQTRFYVYTYVNDWGWESPPSPVSNQADALQASTVTISGFAAPPAGNYAINRIRIYRTQTGESGATEFFFLREIAIGTATTTDDNRTLGEVLPTTTWLPAPDDLSHLTAGWNGMLFGISGGGLRPSEAYVPYAYPLQYEILPPDSKAVALGVFGQALLALTTGRPLLVSGSSPDSLDQQALEMPQACIAPRSVASMGAGVAWASNDGLCWYGQGGARILTAGILTREQWLALNPASMIGCMVEGLYFGSYDDGSGRKSFMIDPINPTGVYFIDTGFTAMHFDELQDQLYVLTGTSVQRWDAASTYMTTVARSKEFRLPRPEGLGWLEVTADAYPVTVRVDCMNLPAGEVTKLTTIDPRLTAPTPTSIRYTATVTSREPAPLPAGWMADDWQIEVETAGAVQGVALASSIEELAET